MYLLFWKGIRQPLFHSESFSGSAFDAAQAALDTGADHAKVLDAEIVNAMRSVRMPPSLTETLLCNRPQEVKDDALRQAIRSCSFDVPNSEVIDAMGSSVQMPRFLARQLLNGRSLEVKDAALREQKYAFAPWS